MTDTVAGLRRTAGRLLPLGVNFLATGLAGALIAPFLPLFLTTAVGADPVHLTAYLIVVPLTSVAVASVVARVSDRWPIRRRLVLAAATAAAVDCLLFTAIRDYWVLLGLAVTLAAFSGTLFPQAFAYAREVMQQANPARSAAAVSVLRTVFSVSWVVGPPLGAVLLSAGGFPAVYGTAAASYSVCVVVALLLLRNIPRVRTRPGEPDEPRIRPGLDTTRPRLWMTVAGFTALQCVSMVGVLATALYVTRDLGGAVRDSGLILGLCAALEIPLMLAFGALSTRFPLSRLILIGTACGVVYYGLASTVGHSWHLAVLQVLNAIFLASWNGLGITYVQDMLPSSPGRATTLFTNAYPMGSILAGLVIGASQSLGHRTAFVAGAVLCLSGQVLLALGRPPRHPTPVTA